MFCRTSLLFIVFLFVGCAKKNVEIVQELPSESLTNVQYNQDYIFTNKNIKWCSVPVPASVSKQSQTHPSIVYVPDKWNGYTHWLGTTPYPNADVSQENPCIYFSNQDNNTTTPPTSFLGIPNNPISKKPKPLNSYNSDIELFLDNDTLYSIIRESQNNKFIREIKIQSSADGLTWTAPKHLYSEKDAPGLELLSPAIIKKEDDYLIYHLNGNAGNSYTGKCTSLQIMKSGSISDPQFKYFKEGKFINKDILKVEPWHMDLFEYNNKLYMVFCGRNLQKPSLLYTYLAVSEDYTNFYIYPKPLISVFDTYRPTAYVDENQLFNLYFSVVGNYAMDGSDRAIGLAQIRINKLIEYLSR